MKEQKGITLIALIITIMVMLILVGVTINIAINGGLFEQARDAAKGMEVEADRERLISAVVASVGSNARIDANLLKTNVEDIGFTITGNSFPYTCTSEKGNAFLVYQNGDIEEFDKNKTVTDNLTGLYEVDLRSSLWRR